MYPFNYLSLICIYLPIHLYTRIHLPTYPLTYLSIYPPTSLFIYSPIYPRPSVHPLTFPSTHLFLHSFICLSFHLWVLAVEDTVAHATGLLS